MNLSGRGHPQRCPSRSGSDRSNERPTATAGYHGGRPTAVLISRSSTHIVLGGEVSREMLRRHVALLRELARLAEDDPHDREEV